MNDPGSSVTDDRAPAGRGLRRGAAVAAAVPATALTIAMAVAAAGMGVERPVVATVLALALVGANLAPVLAISGGRIDAFTPVGALLVPIGLLLPLPEAVVVYALGEGVGVLVAHRLDTRLGPPEDGAAERNAFVIGKSILGALLGLVALQAVAGPEPGVADQVLAALVGVVVSTAADRSMAAALAAAVGPGSFRDEALRGIGELSLVVVAEVVVGAAIAVLAGRDPWSLLLAIGMLSFLMVAGTAYSRAAADRADTAELLALARALQSTDAVVDVEQTLLATARQLLPRDDVAIVRAEPDADVRSWQLATPPAPSWLVTPRIVDTRDYEQQPLAVVEAAVSLARVAVTRARATQQLVSQGELRSLVLATVAHDLRGPLGVAHGAVELLLDHPEASRERSGELLAATHRSVQRVQQLVDDLLELERVEQHVGGVASADVAEVLDLVLDELGDDRVEVVAAGSRRVAVPPVSLGRVLSNLLANARKYSPDGASVVVRVAPGRDGGTELVIEDHGPGIPAAERDLIFEPFEQAGRERGGHGLGLYLARRFVERHGGSIWVEEAPDGGAAFHVWLPDAVEPATAEDPQTPVADSLV